MKKKLNIHWNSCLIKIIILLLTLSATSATAQPFPNFHDQNYQKHNGMIETNDAVKIGGTFEFAYWEFPTYNLKLYTTTGKMIRRYSIRKIKTVVLAGSDGWLSNKDSTYFIVHDKSKHFYRQLTFGNDFQLYDAFFNVDEYVGMVTPYFLIKTKGKFVELKHVKDLINWLRENEETKIKWNSEITVQQIIRQLNGMTNSNKRVASNDISTFITNF